MLLNPRRDPSRRAPTAGSASRLAQHADQHRPKDPILLAVDPELAEEGTDLQHHVDGSAIFVGVGSAIWITGFMLMLSILLVFIGLPLFFFGLAMTEAGLKGWR